MSGSAAPGQQAADSRSCVGCDRAFASPVPFCPFCGVAQAVAASPPAQPIPVAPPMPPNVTAPAAPPEIVAPVQPEQQPVRVAPAPLASAAPRQRQRWVAWVVALALVIVAAEVLSLRPAPSADLVVHVHGPTGALLPAGEILVDNRPAGAPGETLTVAPGPITVGYASPGWRADPRSVTVAAGASLTVDLVARELPGHLALNTSPDGASVTAGGRSYGRTPVSVDLPPGTYDMSLSLAGYVGKVVSVTIVRGVPATISLDLAVAPPRRVEPPFDRGVITSTIPLAATPSQTADTLAVLDPGAEVQIVSKVLSDPAWLEVRTHGRAGYVPAVGVVEPWQAWAQRNSVAGPVDGVTPDLSMMIMGRAYPLAGVQAPARAGPDLARMNAALLTSLHGAQLRCTPHDTASFLCLTQDNRDVALLYLLNGAAAVSDGAPAAYADAQRAAQEQRRGAWGP